MPLGVASKLWSISIVEAPDVTVTVPDSICGTSGRTTPIKPKTKAAAANITATIVKPPLVDSDIQLPSHVY